MKLKKEDQSVDTLVLLSRGNKISMGGDTETKCGAETEGDCPETTYYLIYSHQTQILFGCQQVLADRSLIMSPEWLCQNLINTKLGALTQPLD